MQNGCGDRVHYAKYFGQSEHLQGVDFVPGTINDGQIANNTENKLS